MTYDDSESAPIDMAELALAARALVKADVVVRAALEAREKAERRVEAAVAVYPNTKHGRTYDKDRFKRFTPLFCDGHVVSSRGPDNAWKFLVEPVTTV